MTKSIFSRFMDELEEALCKHCGEALYSHSWLRGTTASGRCAFSDAQTFEPIHEAVPYKIGYVLRQPEIENYREEWISLLKIVLNPPVRKTCDDYD